MFTFGLRPPEEKHPKYWWGARAIFQNKFERNWNRKKKSDPDLIQVVEIDLLYDRQSYFGPENKEFTNWINKVGLPAIRKWAKNVFPDSRDQFNFEDKDYHIIATPNGSYGYMYIGAWSIEEKEVENA
jgi:hypothetical protein